MKTTKRFDKAVTKLYTAFHNDELNPMDCAACAVGNILDNDNSWLSFFEMIGRRTFENRHIKSSGYSSKQLSDIEHLFIYGSTPGNPHKFQNTMGKMESKTNHIESKEMQFQGLCAVVEYLCELDGIENVMDYTKLFEYENDKPKYQLK